MTDRAAIEAELQAQERYLSAVQRLRNLLTHAHHNRAGATDLDALDDLTGLAERVMLHGETVRVLSAQAYGAERKRERDAAFAAGAAGRAGEAQPDADTEEEAEGEQPAATEGGAADPEGEASGNAAGSTVIRGQRPPVAKPGRARGWQGSKARTADGEA